MGTCIGTTGLPYISTVEAARGSGLRPANNVILHAIAALDTAISWRLSPKVCIFGLCLPGLLNQDTQYLWLWGWDGSSSLSMRSVVTFISDFDFAAVHLPDFLLISTTGRLRR